jgi:parallel beta-helix repeat protein
MNYRSSSTITLTLLAALPLALPVAGCGQEAGTTDTANETETGDGDGDPGDGDGDGDPGDGDGDQTGDGDGDGDDPNFPLCSCADFPDADCHQIAAGDIEALQIAANSLEDGSALVLGLGVYELDNQVTIRADDITVCGQGIGVEGSFDSGTTLDFATQATQSNGVDVVGNNFVIRDLAIVDAKKDGLRVEDSDGVTIQRVRATWRNTVDPTNGSYGLYPVHVSHVLIEDSAAYNSSDAGIYVGQCQHAIVRNNIAKGNVAGIEIENTAYADVYGNIAEENTGGLLIFDLPGNPVIGRDIHIHDNIVRNNNTTNFAPGGTVKQIPVGTGTFAMASRRVEINNNTYENNGTSDIAILSGLVIEGDPEAWALSMGEIVNDISDLNLPMMGDTVYNYRTEDVLIHDNTHTGSGTNPYLSGADQEFGLLLAIVYGQNLPIDQILYDAIEESSFSPTDPSMTSNDHHICVGGTNSGATFASLDVESLINGATFEDLFRPASPFTPYDCDSFTGEPIIDPEMEEME